MSLRKPIFISDQGYSQEMDGYVDSINLNAISLIDESGAAKVEMNGTSGDVRFDGYATIASAKISDLTQSRVVFAGADGALVDSEAFTYVEGQLTLGATGANSTISLQDSNNTSRVLLQSAAGTIGAMRYDGSAFFVIGAEQGPNYEGQVYSLNANGTQGFVFESQDNKLKLNSLDQENNPFPIQLDGSTGAIDATSINLSANADINGTLDVAGQVDLAASGVATNVRGSLSVAENASFDMNVQIGGMTGAGDPAYDPSLTVGNSMHWGSFTTWGPNEGNSEPTQLFRMNGNEYFMVDNGTHSTQITPYGIVAEDADFSGEATLASAIVSDLTETRVVFAGADGALVDDGALTFGSNTLTVGGPGNGTVTVKDANNNLRSRLNSSGILLLKDSATQNRLVLSADEESILWMYSDSGAEKIKLDGSLGDGYFAGKLDVGALALNVDGYAFIQNLQMPTGEAASGLDAVNRDYVDTLVNAASDSSFSDFTAAESLALGNPVFIDAAGKAAKAMANSVDDAKAWVMGVAKAAASADASVEIIRDGVCAGALTGLSFAAGDQIWLDSAGGLANARPLASGDRLILVGFAKTADDLFVDIRDYGKNV